ncbi:MAG: hypothetical protein ACXWNE_11090, partial [Candidatus Binataceae bacterium]
MAGRQLFISTVRVSIVHVLSARILALSFICIVAIAGAARPDSAPPTVTFAPQGTVKNVRQAVARFSQPMVPMGDPRVTQSPFQVDCPQGTAQWHGTPRWIDSRQWSYDFDQDLPAGVRCTFTLAPGLKTLKGAALESHPPFIFDTGGPAVIETRPWMGDSGIDEHQAFVLVLDAEPVERTVLDHAEFAVKGMPQRVGATIMSGADRDLLLKRFSDFINHRPAIILHARQEFPDNADIKLIWGKGIATVSGIATAQDQEINFKVRPAFEAVFRCERENPSAACIPVTPMRLSFSAPISAENVKRVTIAGSDGIRRPAQLPDSADLSDIRNLVFPGPFNESAQYTIEIPSGLTDDTGRPLANASHFPLAVKTDEFPPLAKFSARFGIIEEADPTLPVTMRNLEPLIRGARLQASGKPSPTGAPLRDFLSRIDARVFGLSTPDAPAVISWLRRVASAQRSRS